MTVSECYAKLNADYEAALRLLRKETLVQKFALKFLEDPSFGSLVQALDAEELDAAFHAAHTLKGVAGNLSFVQLYQFCSELTELLRAGKLQQAKEYFPCVNAEYEKTVDAIRGIDASAP